jgi:hypothetical protein
MKKILILLCIAFACMTADAQVALDSVNRDAQYVNTIVNRSKKIVDALNLQGDTRINVLNIVCNRYFLLNDIQDRCNKATAEAKANLQGEAKTAAIKNAENERDAELYKHHFEFPATLSNYISDSQIVAIQDGMTYNTVKVTYDAYLDMIPTLKPEEKVQILAWLKEAREFAADAANSDAKHAWFGKYKGRINNWLSQRGYNLNAEREQWAKRIEAKKKQK